MWRGIYSDGWVVALLVKEDPASWDELPSRREEVPMSGVWE
jgi:hypothetical protein